MGTGQTVSYYEGLLGLNHVFSEILKEDKTILLLRSVFDDQNKQLDEVINNMLAKQIKNNIHTHTITPLVENTKENYLTKDKDRLVTRHITKNKNFLLPAQILISGNKVVIASLKDKYFATLINHQYTAHTFKKLFDLIWELTQAEHDKIVSSWKNSLQI